MFLKQLVEKKVLWIVVKLKKQSKDVKRRKKNQHLNGKQEKILLMLI
jgi:hypothetical protein